MKLPFVDFGCIILKLCIAVFYNYVLPCTGFAVPMKGDKVCENVKICNQHIHAPVLSHTFCLLKNSRPLFLHRHSFSGTIQNNSAFFSFFFYI